jgi:hypothetical protein
MSLHADLLDQAEQLAQLDPRRPKNAGTRTRANLDGLSRLSRVIDSVLCSVDG